SEVITAISIGPPQVWGRLENFNALIAEWMQECTKSTASRIGKAACVSAHWSISTCSSAPVPVHFPDAKIEPARVMSQPKSRRAIIFGTLQARQLLRGSGGATFCPDIGSNVSS